MNDNDTFKQYDILNETWFGPFNNDSDASLQLLLDNIESMTIDYSARNIIPEEAPASANCYMW
jgi:hypothetical protein